jgi:hypothetical protein
MPDQLQSIVQRMIDAGESEDNIAAVIREYKTAAPAATTPAPPAKRDVMDDPWIRQAGGKPASELWQRAKDNPVKTGAMIGSAALGGGPSALMGIARAALGAAGGAGYGIAADAVRRGPSPSMRNDVSTMAREGATAAAGEAGGRAVGEVAKKAGKLVYKTALRPSQGIQREFGDVAESGLRRGTPVDTRGLERTEGALRSNSASVDKLLADAEAAGAAPLTTKEVASEFGDVFQQGRRQTQIGKPDPRPAVVGRLKAFNARNPNGIPLTRAQELKGEAQDLATRAYRAEDLGNPINDLSAASDKAMARGLRKGIETRVPDVGPINADSQELIGLLRAVEDATRRNVPGVGSLRSLLGDFMPSVASRSGIALDRAGRSPLVPAAFRTALLAALGQGQE